MTCGVLWAQHHRELPRASIQSSLYFREHVHRRTKSFPRATPIVHRSISSTREFVLRSVIHRETNTWETVGRSARARLLFVDSISLGSQRQCVVATPASWQKWVIRQRRQRLLCLPAAISGWFPFLRVRIGVSVILSRPCRLARLRFSGKRGWFNRTRITIPAAARDSAYWTFAAWAETEMAVYQPIARLLSVVHGSTPESNREEGGGGGRRRRGAS